MPAFDAQAFGSGFDGSASGLTFLLADRFDSLLISTCSILIKGTDGVDVYNVEFQNLTPVATDVRCRVSSLTGREWKQGKKVSVNTKKIFMRPFTGLTEHHWIQVGSVVYDILDIENPSLMDHHYEILVEEVKP
jgi:hypothetical protein